MARPTYQKMTVIEKIVCYRGIHTPVWPTVALHEVMPFGPVVRRVSKAVWLSFTGAYFGQNGCCKHLSVLLCP